MKIILLMLSALLCGCEMKARVESKPNDPLSEATKKLDESVARLQEGVHLRGRQQELDTKAADIFYDCVRVEPKMWRKNHCAARKEEWLKESAELQKEFYELSKQAASEPQKEKQTP